MLKFILALVSFLVPLAALHAGDAPMKLPNIVFVLADDMGYGDASCFNKDSKIRTVHLDKLASQGMRFTDAHSGTAICTPTRYHLLTGRYAWRTGLKGVLVANSPPIIEANRLTLATFLRRLGYHTAVIGKWHLGFDRAGTKIANGPIARGFDYFYGFQYARGIEEQLRNDGFAEKQKAIDVAPKIVAEAAQYLEQRAKEKQPFFLYMPLSSPHTPIVPTSEFQGKTPVGAYGDFVLQTDAALGKVMETLDRTRLADNTLLIFTSDNGSPNQSKGHRSNDHFRGKKGTVYEGGHRVPFVARWPGKVAAGSACEHTITLGDLFATCAEMHGKKLPDNAGLDSVSFLGHLSATSKGPSRDGTVHHDGYGHFAIRQGPWCLVFPAVGAKKAKKGGEVELYHLGKDIGQTKNVRADHPDVVLRLTQLMQRYVDDGRSTPGPAQKNDVAVQFRPGKK